MDAGPKDPGRRQNGWEVLRERIENATKPEGPRLLVFNTCRQFIRTVPVLPRNEVDMDDADNAAEDHVRGGSGSDFGIGEEGFRSRSVGRFPCRTSGCCQGHSKYDRVFGSGGKEAEAG